MSSRTAQRMGLIQESATFAVADTVKRLRAEGRQVWDLGGGDPDAPTPGHIVDAAFDAARQGDTHYVASRGVTDLRQVIAEKFRTDNGLTYDPASQILVTPSAKHALFIAILSTCDPGDEVLVLSPSWVSYEAMLRFAGAEPRFVALDGRAGFELTSEALEAVITPQTRAIMVNTPNNPTGRRLTAAEGKAIADCAVAHDMLVIADEIYEKIAYDDRPHVSIAAYDGCADRTITINGFSKAYAMTGWRLGYLGAPAGLVEEMLKAQQHTVGCAGSFVQAGGIAALRGPQDCVERMREEYAARRSLLVAGLNALPGLRCAEPEGAFYVFPEFDPDRFGDDLKFASWLLEKAGVAVTPGSAFGPGGERHVRMSFANDRPMIESALEAVSAAWPG